MTYGDGSVYQRNDGRWVAALMGGYTATGKRRRITITAKTKAEAKRKLRDRRAEIAKANDAPASNAARTTVKTWADEWLTMRVRKVRPKTWETDANVMRHWVIPTIGTRRLTDLGPRDLRAIENAQRDAGRGPASLARAHWVIRRMLKDAIREGYHVPSAALVTEAPTTPESDREALETIQALAVLHHAVDQPNGARWLIAFYQGLRQGEALGLTWDAVDFDRGTITIEWQLQPLPYLDKHDHSRGFRVPDAHTARHLAGRFHLVRPKTKKGYRVIPMVPLVADMLAAQYQHADDRSGLVWTRPNGWPIDKAHDSAQWRALQQSAGVHHPSGRPYYGHEIRNTTATLLKEAGADEVTIMAIMGHSSYAASKHYISARQPGLREALEAVAEQFRPKEIG